MSKIGPGETKTTLDLELLGVRVRDADQGIEPYDWQIPASYDLKTRLEANTYFDYLLAQASRQGPEQYRTVAAALGKKHLFFLMTRILGRLDIDKDWLYERCVQVELEPDGYLDLWAREHYKSTIITFGRTLQDILNDPEITVGIFSCTRGLAKDFLRQIKNELENNDALKALYPDVLFQDPKRQAPIWSEDKGLVVKRKTNPREATVEAWGLVDGQPTGKHFKLLVYDDVVTLESVGTPQMIEKVTQAWAISLNLGARGGRIRYIGTRYHYHDTYRTMMDRGSAIPRHYPATKNGKADGEPVLLTPKALADKHRDMGPYVFACQMLLNPLADKQQGFKKAWLRFYHTPPEYNTLNIYLLVDPADAKRKESDYTVMVVIGLGADRNYYLLDGLRDKLNLQERTEALFELHRQWMPLSVGYEKVGLQSDISHIEGEQERIGYRFPIIPLTHQINKDVRIRRLQPVFYQGRFWMPRSIWRTRWDGTGKYNFVAEFIRDEYMEFPVAAHDDMLDCMASILDSELSARFPKVKRTKRRKTWHEKMMEKARVESDGIGGETWMSS